MSPSLTRRAALRWSGIAVGTVLAGCSALFGDDGADVTIRNEHAEPHTITVALEEFDETVSLGPNADETFGSAVPQPTYPTTVTATVEMDDERTLESVTLGKELEAFVVTVTADGDLQSAQKGW